MNKIDYGDYNLGYIAVNTVEQYIKNDFAKNMADLDERISRLEKAYRIGSSNDSQRSIELYYPIKRLRSTHNDVETSYSSMDTVDRGSQMVMICKILDMHNTITQLEKKGDKNE